MTIGVEAIGGESSALSTVAGRTSTLVVTAPGGTVAPMPSVSDAAGAVSTFVVSAPVGAVTNAPSTIDVNPSTTDVTITNSPYLASQIGALDLYGDGDLFVGYYDPVDNFVDAPGGGTISGTYWAYEDRSLVTRAGAYLYLPDGSVDWSGPSYWFDNVLVAGQGGGGPVATEGPVLGALSVVSMAAPVGQAGIWTPVYVTGEVAAILLGVEAGAVAGMVIDRSGGVPTMTLDTYSVESPGSLAATITGAPPYNQVTFYLDLETDVLLTGTTDASGFLRVQVPVEVAAVGTHQVGFVINGAPIKYVSFTVTAVEVASTPMPSGVAPPMPNYVDRWVFQAYDFSDINSVEEWVLPINPRTISRSFGELSITSEPTTVSNGRVISWEGAPKPATWTWSGHLLDEGSYREMLRWGQTGQRFYVTDHWGTRYLVKVASFSVIRKRDIERPWHHTYDMQAYILDGPGVIR